FHAVLGSRRAWKTLQSGENVWPPHLEAALLEGESHVAHTSAETRVLGRYRGRNQFISEYIFNKTGERRSNKQVGSRLQQLRHCSSDSKLRRLLRPFREPASHSHGCPSEIPVMHPTEREELIPYVDLPQTILISIPIFPPKSPPTSFHPFSQSSFNSHDAVRITNHPRDLQSIAPTVAFLSQNPAIAQSWFTVYLGEKLVHSETAPLMILKDGPAHGTGFLHTTALAPSYWTTILNSPDPSKFVIF
ncbi:hypothetical protein DFH09DRAFT_1413512, partial [Mycena vulgaris]